MKKSQISVEFLFAIGIIIGLFLIVLLFSLNRETEVKETKVYLDARSECWRLANLVSAVYAGGDGTEVKTHTNYLISFHNYSTIIIESIESIEKIIKNRIAYLVSDCGPGLGYKEGSYWYFDEDAFNDFSEKLEADFYYQCTSICDYFYEERIGQTWNNCPQSYKDHGIDQPLSELLANISKYDTIYLEDSHITQNVEETKTILKEWVSNKKILILSEHFLYLTGYPDYIGDYDFAGMTLHQRRDPQWQPATVIKEDPFYNLVEGETMEIEESSSIEEIITGVGAETADSGIFTGDYEYDGGSYTDTFLNNDDYWYFGATNSYDITAYAELMYDISSLGISVGDINSLNFQINYCHDGSNYNYRVRCDGDRAEGDAQGYQDVEIYNYSNSQWVKIGELRTNDNGYEISDEYSITENLQDYVSNNEIKIRYELDYLNVGSDDSWLVIDYAPLTVDYTGAPEEKLVVVVKYDANADQRVRNQAAIGHWPYGDGIIFYFADFNANMLSKDFYGDVLTELVKSAYYQITPKQDEAICTLYARSRYNRLTGDLTIRNENNMVIINGTEP